MADALEDRGTVAVARALRVVARASLSLMTLAVVLIGSTPAAAAPGHALEDRFGGTGSGPGSFSQPSGIDVSATDQDVFVADQGNGRVQRFTADGGFVGQFDGSDTPSGSMAPGDVAVDPLSNDVYVADVANAVVNRFTADGEYVSQIDSTTVGIALLPAGLAVNRTSGSLYIANRSAPGIHVVDSSGVLQSTIPGPSTPIDVAVDSSGNVYVANGSPGSALVQQFAPDGTPLATVYPSQSVYTIGIDQNDDLYVLEGLNFGTLIRLTQIYDAGTKQASFGAGIVGRPVFRFDGSLPAGIGIDHTSGRLYVADQSANDVPYFEAFTVPDVTTGPPSNVTADTATVSGTLNALGISSHYHFEYGTTPAYGLATPGTDAGSGTEDVPAEAALTDLQPNQTYHYRLVGSNSSGRNPGENETLTTLQAPPAVDAAPPAAVNVKAINARFTATVNPNNLPTTYHFEYGTSSGALDSVTEPQDAGGGFGDGEVSQLVTGLVASTTYHFRVVADNGVGGPISGATGTFTTPALPPSVIIQPTTDVASSSARVNASIDSHGQTGSYRFSIEGLDSAYSSLTPPVALESAVGAQAISVLVSGLPSDGVFRVRVIATTDAGAVQSAPTQFETLPLTFAPPPVADIGFPYGCAFPRLTGYRGHAAPGKTVILQGEDLGASGSVSYGSRVAEVVSHDSGAVAIIVPRSAAGRQQVRVHCGQRSNAIVVAARSSNRFSLSAKVIGASARMRVSVPGAGKIVFTGTNLVSARRTVKKRGVSTVTLTLSKVGRRMLAHAKSRQLAIRVRVRFTPTGGTSTVATRIVTFKRKAGR